MPITLTQLQDIARHELHGSDPGPQVAIGDIVNDAGEAMIGSCAWTWLERPTVSVGVVALQPFVVLPSDLAELVSVQPRDAALAGFFLTTMDRIAHLRNVGTGAGLSYSGAMVWPTQTGVGAAPGAPRLELWPTPTATVNPAFDIVYRAGWTRLAAGSDVANVPQWIEPVLKEFVRAVARGTETGVSMSEAIGSVLGGGMYRAAIKRDRNTLREFAPGPGGHLARASAGIPANGFAQVIP